jgi:hypothetical protein
MQNLLYRSLPLSASENKEMLLLYDSIEEVISYLDARFGVKGYYTYHTKRGKAKYYYAIFACPRSGEPRRKMVSL